MADFTGKEIRSSFMKLLGERSYKDITVKDIVEDCGISRSSFYYHFHDIPELLETIILEKTTEIMERYPVVSSIDDCVGLIADFTLEHKKLALHLYQSVRRDLFDSYLWKISDYAVQQYLSYLLQGETIAADDFAVVSKYYTSVVFGIVSRWHMEGAPDGFREELNRVLELHEGQIEAVIERCKNQ